MNEPFWKKCKKCGKEWTKLTPNGECGECNPAYLVPKNEPKKEEKETKFKEEQKDNPPYFNK